MFCGIFLIFIKWEETIISEKNISLRDLNQRKMNKVLAIIACSSLIVCSTCKRETKDERFQRDFQQFTQKECPKFVDPYTCLDSAIYDIESRTLSYHYTVQEMLDNESIYTDELTEAFHEDILKGLKNSIQLKPYKDEGITFHYDYYSKTTGKMLLEMTFNKEDYQH